MPNNNPVSFNSIFKIIETLGISGWIKVLYDYISNRPKIKGKIFTVIIGQMPNPMKKNERLTTYLVYLYLTNNRKRMVHILDYEMEINFGNGFKKLDRVYGMETFQSYTFYDINGQEIIIPNFKEKLIYKKISPVEYGKPYHGFILFAGSESFYNYTKQIKKYKIKCIDAFGNKHIIKAKPKNLGNIYLLQELAEIVFPPPKN